VPDDKVLTTQVDVAIGDQKPDAQSETLVRVDDVVGAFQIRAIGFVARWSSASVGRSLFGLPMAARPRTRS
jgi:hypothetical protein